MMVREMERKSIDRNNTVIVACSSMLLHVSAAQERMGTDFEVIELDRNLHMEPLKMRERILETLKVLPGNYTTILVAMGYCGGSWNNVPVSRRLVIPKVDDCITMLLHTDDTPHNNLKRVGHMYFRDCDTGAYSIEAMKEKICHDYGMEFGTSIFGSWFASYTNADIIDTGAYDCYSEEYVMEAQKNADLIRCTLDYVAGSNLILEKLVSGRWDEQVLVLNAGQEVSEQEFGFDVEENGLRQVW